MSLDAIAVGALVDSSIFFLTAVAFALVYMTRQDGLFHLAQGGVMIVAAAVFNRAMWLGAGMLIAALAGTGSGALLSIVIEFGVYARLRLRGAPSAAFMLASLGLLIVQERAVSIWMGTKPLFLRSHTQIGERVGFLGSELWHTEIAAISVSAALAVLFLLVYSGRWGQRLIALRQSFLMYDWRVGRSTVAIATVSLISGTVASLAAVLGHLEHRVVIDGAGLRYLLPAFVVVLMARTLSGRIALILPLHWRSARTERAMHVAMIWLVSYLLAVTGRFVVLTWQPRWKDTVFLILAITVLLVFSGRRAESGEEAAAA